MNLIREIRLPNGRMTKNLGFGCAGILRVPTRRLREKLLRTAVDSGITHFDMARMYGAGAAEGIVGSTLRRQRHEITMATKFGLPCGIPSARTVWIQSTGRWVLNLHPGIKRWLRPKVGTGGERNYDYSGEEMESSLQTSLDQLQTDHVDLFFIHEPRAKDQVPPGLNDLLRLQKEKGRIGAYGLSGTVPDIMHFLELRPDLVGEAIQYPFSLDPAPEALRQKAFTGVFHVLAGPLALITGYLAGQAHFTREWSEKLSLDLRQPENIAAVILAMPLSAYPGGMALFFTSKASRLRRLAHRLTDNCFTPEFLAQFQSELARRLNKV